MAVGIVVQNAPTATRPEAQVLSFLIVLFAGLPVLAHLTVLLVLRYTRWGATP